LEKRFLTLEAAPKAAPKAANEGNPGILRLRVGGYRVIFKFKDTDSILVSHIEPRGQAYAKKTKSNRGK
jgi:mRNA-degrading endonuclease RelE of RelBE toxin-antitoxin system